MPLPSRLRDRLADIWYHGWQDAHAEILSQALAVHRTWASMRERLEHGLADVRVAQIGDTVAGFCLAKHDELNQLYVAPGMPRKPRGPRRWDIA